MLVWFVDDLVLFKIGVVLLFVTLFLDFCGCGVVCYLCLLYICAGLFVC